MFKYRFAFCLQLVFLLGLFSAAEAIKPRPPLQLSLLRVDLSEKQSQLILTATAHVDSNQVALSIDLPIGISLVEGKDQWEGALKKGETKKIEIIVENQRHQPQKIVGKATLHLMEGETFVQQSTLILNDPKTKSPLPAPSVKRKQGEEKILEFKGK
jgi:hypothetical protein